MRAVFSRQERKGKCKIRKNEEKEKKCKEANRRVFWTLH